MATTQLMESGAHLSLVSTRTRSHFVANSAGPSSQGMRAAAHELTGRCKVSKRELAGYAYAQ